MRFRLKLMGFSPLSSWKTRLKLEIDWKPLQADKWDSGIYIRPGGRSGVAIDKTQLTRLHGPVFYLTGGPSDIAHENALDDFEKLQHVPVVVASLPVGHGGTFSAPDGGDWARVTLRWLDWQLKRDADASKEFVGPSCRLCTDTRWTVKQKNLPQAAGAALPASK